MVATRYSINLYFPVKAIEKALISTMEIVHAEIDGFSTLNIPTDFLNLSNYEYLDLMLLSPMDPVIQTYSEFGNGLVESTAIIRNGIRLFQVGYVDLVISVGERYAEFSYIVRASTQNKLFAESTAIHQQFLHVLKSTGGIAAVIDNEHREFVSLGDHSKTFEMEQELYWDTVTVDQFVEAVLQKILDSK